MYRLCVHAIEENYEIFMCLLYIEIILYSLQTVLHFTMTDNTTRLYDIWNFFSISKNKIIFPNFGEPFLIYLEEQKNLDYF